MALFDLIGRGQIESQRRQADLTAIDRYNPNIYNPQLEEARQQSQEGIVDEPIRQRVLEQLLSRGQQPSSLESLSSGRALAATQSEQSQRMDALSDAESNIALKEEEAKREGRGRVASIMAKMNQVESQRQAQIQQNRLMAEAEANRRKNQLVGAVGKLAGQAAGVALGGPSGGAAGGALGGLLAGGVSGGNPGMGMLAGASAGFASGQTQQQLDAQQQNQEQNMSNTLMASLGQDTGYQEPVQTLDTEQNIQGTTTPNVTDRASNIATQTQEGRESMRRQELSDYFGFPVGMYDTLAPMYGIQ